MRQSLVVFALVIAAATGGATRQSPPQPAVAGQPIPGQATPARATPARDPVKGTAVLRGQVVDALTGTAVRRARVTAVAIQSATPIQVPATQFQGPARAIATTDADGRFEIRELVAGRYTVSASKPGYLLMQYGQKAMNEQAVPIEVLDGQRVEKIIIGIPRGGVITGRVLDDFGDPVMGAEVRVLRYRYQNGRRQLTQSGGAFGGMTQTDDLGAFRVYALEPGSYYVSANPRQSIDFQLAGEPRSEGFAQTFFPGTASPQEAKPVVVQAGREVQGIVFSLASTRLARIRGRAVMSSGEPFAGAFVNVSYRDASGGTRGTSGASVRPDGSFEIQNVAPGTYMLSVQRNDFGPRDPPPDQEIGRELVTVNGEDISNILLVGSRGAIARGSGISPPTERCRITSLARRGRNQGSGCEAGETAMTKTVTVVAGTKQ